ncbi:uncharacterized protein LOC127750547 [Frankliniella occidentalis]|uniref:Uncharacterized protein LOC127750547 n=1 Tax=Frankliniella occidentalis TaxID=133901 RepID=A0A9C6XRJ1_FRAOC|nr:uncharacterized protein LOC127750547 [Frankliniella occidentalis]
MFTHISSFFQIKLIGSQGVYLSKIKLSRLLEELDRHKNGGVFFNDLMIALVGEEVLKLPYLSCVGNDAGTHVGIPQCIVLAAAGYTRCKAEKKVPRNFTKTVNNLIGYHRFKGELIASQSVSRTEAVPAPAQQVPLDQGHMVQVAQVHHPVVGPNNAAATGPQQHHLQEQQVYHQLQQEMPQPTPPGTEDDYPFATAFTRTL